MTVLAGDFPEPPDDFREGVPYEAPRTDWETWHEIRHSGRVYLPRLRYGDKVPYGRQYDDANREAARCLARLADFRGPEAGAGERWLRDRAHGSVPTGNHSRWNQVGNIQHMTFVVRSLGERSSLC
ncbi:beta family protein [Streptomyces sp. NPDC002076]